MISGQIKGCVFYNPENDSVSDVMEAIAKFHKELCDQYPGERVYMVYSQTGDGYNDAMVFSLEEVDFEHARNYLDCPEVYGCDEDGITRITGEECSEPECDDDEY